MFRLIAPSHDDVRRFLSEQEQAPFSYRELAGTAAQLPAGYNVDHHRVRLGQGAALWQRAQEAVRMWQMFNIPWLRIYPRVPPLHVGTNVVVSVRHFGFYSLNACRIVYIVNNDEPVKRFGFAYGTLLTHAETGEERFTIEWNTIDDEVSYDILAFSRPRQLLAKLGYPFSRLLQRKFARDSMMAMRRAMADSSPQSRQPR